MIVSVFSSQIRLGTYIYLPFIKDSKLDNKIDELPEYIIKYFNKNNFVLHVDLNQKKLIACDNQQVIDAINEQGFYLQVIDPNVFDNSIKV